MNILILHNKYQISGGEDVVVAAEAAGLSQRGHTVRLEEVSNETIVGVRKKMATFLGASNNRASVAWIRALISEYSPDVIHVHNFFPLLSPAIHHAAAAEGVPVVQTLHNYRLICVGALLLRDGILCEKCVNGSRYWGVIHKCYRNSFLGSYAIQRMQMRSSGSPGWRNDVQRFIALTEFARNKFIEGGIPAHKIVVKPNFPALCGELSADEKRNGALFVGRLSHEKGVHVLLNAWARMPEVPLRVAGDGPDLQRLKDCAPPNVTFLGRLTTEAVRHEMKCAQALIIPSISYEGFPMALVEAFACALPVIGSRLGALEEIVSQNQTGFFFEPNDTESLTRVVKRLFANPKILADAGQAARERYLTRYTPEKNLEQLEGIYAKAIEEKV